MCTILLTRQFFPVFSNQRVNMLRKNVLILHLEQQKSKVTISIVTGILNEQLGLIRASPKVHLQ